MLSAAKNWIEDKASGLLTTGVQAGGTLAGNAVGGVGTLVENAGRSTGNAVSGGIGSVGGRINSYGEGIKSSMSADGPVAAAPKKTAVKPSGPTAKTPSAAQKTPAATTAKKIQPSTAGGRQNVPGASQKSGSGARPAQQATKPNTGVVTRSKSAPGNQPKSTVAPGAKTINTGVGSKAPTQTSKPQTSARSQSNAAADGKIRVSPQSRPRATASQPTSRTTTRSGAGPAKKHEASDPLGIGKDFGNMSKASQNGNKMKSQSQSYSQSAPPGKASASDPLALGDEIGKIGKKKK